MQSNSWREKMRIAIVTAFISNVLAYTAKLLLPWSLVTQHVGPIVVLSETGFVVSLLILVFAPVFLTGRRMVTVVIVDLILGYLWFSSIAWWVMVK
jgi:hypothetical protein